jgi:hypothetical protein
MNFSPLSSKSANISKLEHPGDNKTMSLSCAISQDALTAHSILIA